MEDNITNIDALKNRKVRELNLEQCADEILSYFEEDGFGGKSKTRVLSVSLPNSESVRKIVGLVKERLAASLQQVEILRCSDCFSGDDINKFVINNSLFKANKVPCIFVGFDIGMGLIEPDFVKNMVKLCASEFSCPACFIFIDCEKVLDSSFSDQSFDVRYKKLLVKVPGHDAVRSSSIYLTSENQYLNYFSISDAVSFDSLHNLVRYFEGLDEDNSGDKSNLNFYVGSNRSFLLKSSRYDVRQFNNVFEFFKEKYPELAVKCGGFKFSDIFWMKLYHYLNENGSEIDNICKDFYVRGRLDDCFSRKLSTEFERERYFFAVSLIYSDKFSGYKPPCKNYFLLCLKDAECFEDLESNIYLKLLSMDCSSETFKVCKEERAELLKEYSSERSDELSKSFYNAAADKETCEAVKYLSNLIEGDRKLKNRLFVKLCAGGTMTAEMLHDMCSNGLDNIKAYLEPFELAADEVKASSENIAALCRYFDRYRELKLLNRADRDFVYEAGRSENIFISKIGSRWEIVRDHILKLRSTAECALVFCDSLGAEYLPYIRTSVKEKYENIELECFVGCCALPSLTSVNKAELKEQLGSFNLEIKRLDDLKHGGTDKIETGCSFVSIAEELEIIDDLLARCAELLTKDNCVCIVSDHGSSRMAVLADKAGLIDIVDDNKYEGRHSGRCCKACQSDDNVNASFHNGYLSMLSYDRFKGGRGGSCEVHGGAAAEEVMVPVIILRRKDSTLQSISACAHVGSMAAETDAKADFNRVYEQTAAPVKRREKRIISEENESFAFLD